MKHLQVMGIAAFWSALFLGWWYFLVPIQPPQLAIRIQPPIVCHGNTAIPWFASCASEGGVRYATTTATVTACGVATTCVESIDPRVQFAPNHFGNIWRDSIR